MALPAARILSAPPANENDDWNLTGSWQWEAHITAGPDAGQTVNGTVQFDQEGTALGGYFTSSKGNGTLAGTYVNNHLSINYHIPPNYSAHVEASATHDGTRLAGSWADSSGNGGTYVAWGQVPPLPPREQFFGGDGCLGRIPSGESLDPVNTALGNYMHQDVDLQVPAPGLPFAFRRVYNSQDETVGTLGRGWTHSYNLYLVRDGKIVTVTMESGARHVYRQITDTVYYMRPFGVFADLVRGSVGYTLTRPAQVTYTFSLDGHLTGIFDAHGNRVGLGYDGDDLSVITGTVGRAYHLQYDGAGRLTALSDPIGRVVRYGYEGDLLTVITGTRGVTTTITYDAGGRLATLARASRPVVANGYDGEGRVIWQQQWGSSVYTVTYTTESSDGMTYTATTITDPLGRVTTDYHDDHFRHVRRVDALGSEAPTEFDAYYSPRVITDTNGHATRLGYDSNGNVIYAVGLSLPYTTSFTYDSRNDLTSATDAAGYTTLYEYDEQDNLVAQTDPLSGTVHYAYNGCGQVISTTNELGHTTLYGYDELGQRVAMTDTLGNVTAYSYDGVGRLVTTTNPAGQVTVNEYDDGDNLVRVTQNYLSGGYPQNWQNVYNLVTEYGYDALGNRVTVTGTLGHVTRYEYDAANRLVRTTVNYLPGQPQNWQDEYNVVTEYGYDEVSNQILVTDTLGSVTYTEYDELNRVKRTWQNYLPGHPLNWQNEYNIVTEYAYDAVGNQVLVTDTLGHVTLTEYDPLNRPVTVTVNYVDGVYDPVHPDEDLRTVTVYDEVGNAIATVDVVGRVTHFAYDPLGRLITTTDALSGTTVNEYDAAGNRVAITDAEGRVTHYGYDSLGRVVMTTDALSGTTVVEYDALGRRTRVTDAEGNSTRYEYDGAGRLVAVTDALTDTTRYGYDALGRRVVVTDTLGNATCYEYDALGRTVAMTGATGAVTRYVYDALGRQVVVTDATGIATTSAYDDLGRLVETQDALGNTTQYGYDALGNRVVMTDSNGIVTRYEYDGVGRLAAVVENYTGGEQTAGRDVRTEYGYDGLGNRTVITDAVGQVALSYDALNRLVAERDPLGHTTEYTYDRVGNRTVMTGADGGVTLYVYDALNRLVHTQYPDSSVEYAYDRVGNGVAMTDTSGTTTYVYDALYRPITITSPATGTVGYRYDALGNRTQLIYPIGEVVTYTYDAVNRLVQVVDWDNGQHAYAYDAAGRLTGLRFPNGVRSDYVYDAAGRLTCLAHASTDKTLLSFKYTLDGVGNRTRVVEGTSPCLWRVYLPVIYAAGEGTMGATSGEGFTSLGLLPESRRFDFSIGAGATVITYTYDSLYRLVGAEYSTGETFAYTYDAVGNRTTMTDTTSVHVYTYDAANRLTSVDDVPYAWDNRGNLLNDGTFTYTYDGGGRMVQAQSVTATLVYTYNADGLRVAQRVNGVETQFAWDLASPLAQVLATSDGAVYLHGLDLIAEQRDRWQYPLGDALGSVRQWRDTDGGVTYAGGYTPFGVEMWQEGGTAGAWGYTGEWWDADARLLYLRARWYAPEVGRFTQRDPWKGDYQQPFTLHPYAYALANPVLLTDPSGEICVPCIVLLLTGVSLLLEGCAPEPSLVPTPTPGPSPTPAAICTAMPTTGAEPPYEPGRWNDNGAVQKSNNCYSYAANDPHGHEYECKPQPGVAAEQPFWGDATMVVEVLQRVTCDNVTIAAMADGFVPSNCNTACNSGRYKVALVVDLHKDYHWYRQDQGGCWSSKPGHTEVTNLDDSGSIVSDPQLADRNYEQWGYNYSQFCGCFCIPRGGIRTECP